MLKIKYINKLKVKIVKVIFIRKQEILIKNFIEINLPVS